MKNVVIVDIDGCLSDHSDRIKMAQDRNWDAYHQLSQSDPPIEAIVELVKTTAGSRDTEIMICTGRPMKWLKQTSQWLNKHSIPRLAVYMRADGDKRSSAEVKEGFLKAIREHYDVWFAIDDQQSVKEMYERNGVVCLQPASLLDIPPEEGKTGVIEEDRTTSQGADVPSILNDASLTYQERQGAYKNTYKLHGKVMAQVFPDGITLRTEDDFLKYHLFVLEMIKMIRTACSGMTHIDSQHDLMVYAAMFEETMRGGQTT